MTNLLTNTQRQAITDQVNLEHDRRAEQAPQTDIQDISLVKVGQGATQIGYSDRRPFEVIKVTRCTVTVREQKATLDPDWKQVRVPGGFAGVCTNQNTQRWIIESDPNGTIDVLRYTKKGWHGRQGRYKIGAADKFYDFNF